MAHRIRVNCPICHSFLNCKHRKAGVKKPEEFKEPVEAGRLGLPKAR